MISLGIAASLLVDADDVLDDLAFGGFGGIGEIIPDDCDCQVNSTSADGVAVVEIHEGAPLDLSFLLMAAIPWDEKFSG